MRPSLPSFPSQPAVALRSASQVSFHHRRRLPFWIRWVLGHVIIIHNLFTYTVYFLSLCPTSDLPLRGSLFGSAYEAPRFAQIGGFSCASPIFFPRHFWICFPGSCIQPKRTRLIPHLVDFTSPACTHHKTLSSPTVVLFSSLHLLSPLFFSSDFSLVLTCFFFFLEQTNRL